MTVDTEELSRRLERFRSACRSAGVKLTHQRIEIFREVASSSAHPDVETVYRAVHERLPTVSLDTVYRTLWLLNDLGMVTTLGPRRGSVRFDPNLSSHHHYVCITCGRIIDFEADEPAKGWIPEIAPSIGSVVSTHVEVRGVCRRCGAEANSETRPSH